MSVQKCKGKNGDPGWQGGPSGTCFSYNADDHQAARIAYIKALQEEKKGGK